MTEATTTPTDPIAPPQTKPLPSRECDLVMKGGITSGVVYPGALKRLSESYRFVNIGGTSAGAIAAAFAAAAEYGRESGGFEKIEEVGNELSNSVLEKFQPEPAMANLFRLLMSLQPKAPKDDTPQDSRKIDWKTPLAVVWALLRGYPRDMAKGAIPGAILLVLALFASSSVVWGWLIVGLIVLVTGLIAGPALAIKQQLQDNLAKQDYGLCRGRTQAGYPENSGLTDWMTVKLDEIAGLAPGQGPLSTGMLCAETRSHKITVQTMTTDITTRRPFILPMQSNLYAFDETEFRALFPDRVVDAMITRSNRVSEHWHAGDKNLYYFQMDDVPLVVLARMSLSFPGLISAVPLYCIDHTLTHAAPKDRLRRCVFSDGGLSSNFPVHFFDSLLPKRPTFGIALASFDPDRNGPEDAYAGRIDLPVDVKEGRALRTHPVTGLGGFVGALFDSAKDWQDSLQAVLTGFRERIVTINLTETEGGMNLQMPEKTIKLLNSFGAQAGDALVRDFDFEAHRRRRFLTEIRALDDLLAQFAANWAHEFGDAPNYPALALEDGTTEYRLPAGLRQKLHDRAAQIAALGANGLSDAEKEQLPKSRSRLRHIAEMS
ncbi:patatin-like phospholipase [Rhodobacter aestuarii]|uniref:Patatin-like phospholipase n=1 Tax=Rhodobacter aestuarii TaxID=453582 RepID=A0A1N7IU70_9RHOB|nr:patatin-like phospholipase family protein [Rhodobacter aestuarii]PTV97523.1 patatin-like phospholipase [Rhodobacter aestuarii]SIS40645.1 Patatin-like phospholipase [Rhodobacter aestuarii]